MPKGEVVKQKYRIYLAVFIDFNLKPLFCIFVNDGYFALARYCKKNENFEF